jgi:hypothetical protein
MSQPGYPGNQRIVDLNSDAGAFISILAVGTCRRLKIEESTITAEGAANTLQGLLQYKLPNDGTPNGFTTIFQAIGANGVSDEGIIVPAGIELPDKGMANEKYGAVIGQAAQPIVGLPGASNLTTQIPMIELRSGTGTGTSVMVTEYN